MLKVLLYCCVSLVSSFLHSYILIFFLLIFFLKYLFLRRRLLAVADLLWSVMPLTRFALFSRTVLTKTQLITVYSICMVSRNSPCCGLFFYNSICVVQQNCLCCDVLTSNSICIVAVPFHHLFTANSICIVSRTALAVKYEITPNSIGIVKQNSLCCEIWDYP